MLAASVIQVNDIWLTIRRIEIVPATKVIVNSFMKRRNEIHTYRTVSLSQPLKKTGLEPSTTPLSRVRTSIAYGQNSVINSITEWAH